MGDSAGEDHRLGFRQSRRRRAPCFGHRPCAHQQQPRIGVDAAQQRHGGDQIIDPFIGVKAADIADHRRTGRNSQLRRQRIIARPRIAEQIEIDPVAHHPDLACRNAARHQILPQPVADREQRIGPLGHPRFQRAGQAVFDAAFGAGEIADRRIFPESTNFINERHAQRPRRALRRRAAQCGRMGVDDIGPPITRQRADRTVERVDLAQLAQGRGAFRQAGGAVEGQPVGVFGRRTSGGFDIVPLPGDPAHVEPEALLRLQDRARAEGVAAVERQRMVENVENSGHATGHNAGVLNTASTALG